MYIARQSLFRERKRYGLLTWKAASTFLIIISIVYCFLIFLCKWGVTSQRTHLNVLSLWDDSIFNKFDKHQFMTTKYFLFKNMKIINWLSHGRYLKAKLLKTI